MVGLGPRGGADRRCDRARLFLRASARRCGYGRRSLQTSLERLADADIVLVQGLPPVADCRFKHALIQDAAYEKLL